jgi:hypothetical protein
MINLLEHRKRTTLILEHSCVEGVRELAHREKRQISKVVNELLAEGLRRRREFTPSTFELPTFSMGKPLISWADRDALETLMDS